MTAGLPFLLGQALSAVVTLRKVFLSSVGLDELQHPLLASLKAEVLC